MDAGTKGQSIQPGSLPQKEQEPTGGQGYIERVERQPEIPPEVASVGVKPVTDDLTLTEDDKKAGIEPSKEAIPVATQPEGFVELPLTEKQALDSLKIHKNITEAIVWLATFILRQFKILHLLRRKG